MAARWPRRALFGLIPLCAVGLWAVWPYWTADPESEAARLSELLALEEGMTAAELGAGDGRMTVLMARRLGPSGRIFSTEIEDDKLERIRRAAAEAGLENVTAVRAGQSETNLPPSCCKAVFLRKVYHHLTDPALVNRSLFQALQPGGRLAVIDFERPWFLWLPRPNGIPEDRPGHGVPPALVVEELEQAGFVLEKRVFDWPLRTYCLIFRKP